MPHVVWVVFLTADVRSASNMLRLKGRLRPPVENVPGVAEAVTPLQLRALRPATTYVRPRTSDSTVIAESLIGGYCLPPDDVIERPLERIVELGSNIGLGLATLATHFPKAQILGIEADPENHALAAVNTTIWEDRCTFVNAAVWDSPGQLVVERDGHHASGYTVRLATCDESGLVSAVTVESLLDEHFGDEPIDYLYLDIEGAHSQVLRKVPSWLRRVRAIKVSAHIDTPYDEDACAVDLERAGFETTAVHTDTTGWTIGVRQ